MRVLYRISDGGNLKNKLQFANKFYCLDNFVSVFKGIETILIADNCKPETIAKLKKYNLRIIETSLGTLPAWRFCAEYAIEHFQKNEIVYLVEDDYLHLPGSPVLIEEGLEIADYVTLYDHPDKYVNKSEGGNPYVFGGGEVTKVLLSRSTHWKITNSTTHTFAMRVGTLEEDKSIWWKHTAKYHGLNDFKGFKEIAGIGSVYNKLFGKRRTLVSPIPGRSTHIELKYLTPLVNWESV